MPSSAGSSQTRVTPTPDAALASRPVGSSGGSPGPGSASVWVSASRWELASRWESALVSAQAQGREWSWQHSADKGLSEAVQTASAAAQSVVAGRVSVTASSESGSTCISQRELLPSTRLNLRAVPPSTSSASSRSVCVAGVDVLAEADADGEYLAITLVVRGPGVREEARRQRLIFALGIRRAGRAGGRWRSSPVRRQGESGTFAGRKRPGRHPSDWRNVT